MRGPEAAAAGDPCHHPRRLCEALRDWGVGLATSGACATLGKQASAANRRANKTTHGEDGGNRECSQNTSQALKMPWPAFNSWAICPSAYIGYACRGIAQFRWPSAARDYHARLERMFALARRTGSVQRFIIFGSYVTAEPNPVTWLSFS